ncbi:MAG: hypothetical protein JWQ84_544 [Mucilaginibacter sp.]|jgi:hypothetical protein|nr:hypothetical protein [Mucilaginibacter sp.]
MVVILKIPITLIHNQLYLYMFVINFNFIRVNNQ